MRSRISGRYRADSVLLSFPSPLTQRLRVIFGLLALIQPPYSERFAFLVLGRQSGFAACPPTANFCIRPMSKLLVRMRKLAVGADF